MVVPLSMPPREIISPAPLLTVVPPARPPENTISLLPLDTSEPLAVPPASTSTVMPPEMWKPLNTSPDAAARKTPAGTAIGAADALPPASSSVALVLSVTPLIVPPDCSSSVPPP